MTWHDMTWNCAALAQLPIGKAGPGNCTAPPFLNLQNMLPKLDMVWHFVFGMAWHDIAFGQPFSNPSQEIVQSHFFPTLGPCFLTMTLMAWHEIWHLTFSHYNPVPLSLSLYPTPLARKHFTPLQ